MKKELCIECKKRQVFIKKRKLCNICYQRERKKHGGYIDPAIHNFDRNTARKHRLSREIEFIKNFFEHTQYIHHPAMFRLNDTSYSPDFYDIQRNVFIEVSGTKQAYSQNKYKYELLRLLFPEIKFEIRKPDGTLLDESMPINAQLIEFKQN